MSTIVNSLKLMQRMERLATNIYKQQIRAFGGNEISGKLKTAYENEKEHAETLAKIIVKQSGSPSKIGTFFGFAGSVAGFITPILGKRTLLGIDTWIEEKAVQDYSKFVNKLHYDTEIMQILSRIIDDEKRHIETWNAAKKTIPKGTEPKN
jgi:demethoxyubiquinone hydroxylase (CLK1/Coq7/Cat5 family)